MTYHISRPPRHPWRKQHYKHITDKPASNVHFLDGFGTFAGNLAKAMNNMGIAYKKALAGTTAPSSRDHEPGESIRLPAASIAGLMDVDVEAQFRYPDVSDEDAWMYRQCFVEGAKWAAATAMKENR
jgi:hypothetical protein